MLTKLELKNFKSWPEAKLDLAPITGLFGANSSGKSGLIQSLLLLKQTRDATDRGLTLDFGDDRTLVNLGSFRDVVFGRERLREKLPALSWTLEWSPSEPFCFPIRRDWKGSTSMLEFSAIKRASCKIAAAR